MDENPDQKAARLAGELSQLLDGPIGIADCGCPNRVDGTAPTLHICRTCGLQGSWATVHPACSNSEHHREEPDRG